MEYLFKIFRFDPSTDEEPRFQEYAYEPSGQRTMLEALMEVRNEQDASLSLRYSCRESVCGSCAMVINGEFALACRTMVDELPVGTVTVEPLPHLPVLKDLVVDMNPFWNALHKIRAYLLPRDGAPEDGFRVEDKEVESLFQFVNCILCGACYAACPVAARNRDYLGPASLARLNRFVKDSRDVRDVPDVADVNSSAGVWGCHTILRCNAVCPKDVRPADGITSLRRRMTSNTIQRLLRLKR